MCVKVYRHVYLYAFHRLTIWLAQLRCQRLVTSYPHEDPARSAQDSTGETKPKAQQEEEF